MSPARTLEKDKYEDGEIRTHDTSLVVTSNRLILRVKGSHNSAMSGVIIESPVFSDIVSYVAQDRRCATVVDIYEGRREALQQIRQRFLPQNNVAAGEASCIVPSVNGQRQRAAVVPWRVSERHRGSQLTNSVRKGDDCNVRIHGAGGQRGRGFEGGGQWHRMDTRDKEPQGS